MTFCNSKLFFSFLLPLYITACTGVTTDSTFSSSQSILIENSSGSITLNWLPPTQNTDNTSLTDLKGYKIYYGTSPYYLSKTKLIDKGLTEYVLENLQPNTRYFISITALNNSNIESTYSNIIDVTLK